MLYLHSRSAFLPEYSSRRAKHTPDPRIGKEREAGGQPFAFDLHKKLLGTFTPNQVWNQQVDEQPSLRKQSDVVNALSEN
jgi:hypothetical protein